MRYGRVAAARHLTIAVASLLGVACADEASDVGDRVQAPAPLEVGAQALPGFAMPSCGADVTSARQCGVNEQAYDVYIEVENRTLAEWLEYLRVCRVWEEQYEERFPTPPQLRLVGRFEVGSRPGEGTFDGTSTIFVDDVYSARLWTDGVMVRAYFSSFPMVSNALTSSEDRRCMNLTAPLDCSYARDTVSLRSVHIEIPDPRVDDPAPTDRFVFPPVRSVDGTWVSVYYAARP